MVVLELTASDTIKEKKNSGFQLKKKHAALQQTPSAESGSGSKVTSLS